MQLSHITHTEKPKPTDKSNYKKKRFLHIEFNTWNITFVFGGHPFVLSGVYIHSINDKKKLLELRTKRIS